VSNNRTRQSPKTLTSSHHIIRHSGDQTTISSSIPWYTAAYGLGTVVIFVENYLFKCKKEKVK
jgi:hypothetical protein